MFGVTGNDDVLLILGVNIFVRDKDLEIDGFSRAIPFEFSKATLVRAFSISVLELRYLKPIFGKRFLKGDFPLVDEDGPGELDVLAMVEVGVNWKFTLLGVGVGLGVGGIFTMKESCVESPIVLVGICKKRLFRFQR